MRRLSLNETAETDETTETWWTSYNESAKNSAAILPSLIKNVLFSGMDWESTVVKIGLEQKGWTKLCATTLVFI